MFSLLSAQQSGRQSSILIVTFSKRSIFPFPVLADAKKNFFGTNFFLPEGTTNLTDTDTTDLTRIANSPRVFQNDNVCFGRHKKIWRS